MCCPHCTSVWWHYVFWISFPTLDGQSAKYFILNFKPQVLSFLLLFGQLWFAELPHSFFNSQTIVIVHCIIHHFIINFKLGGFHFSCLASNPSNFYLVPVQTKFSIYPTLFYLSLPIKASILNIYFACKKRRSCLLFCLWWNKMDNQGVTN